MVQTSSVAIAGITKPQERCLTGVDAPLFPREVPRVAGLAIKMDDVRRFEAGGDIQGFPRRAAYLFMTLGLS